MKIIFMKYSILLFVLVISVNCHGVNRPTIRDLKIDHNFGVVISNSEYKIYRSESLGKSGLEKLYKGLEELKIKVPKSIISMNYMDYSYIFGHALEQYLVKDQYGYEFFHAYDRNYRTYLDGRNPLHPEKDIDDLTNMRFWAKPIPKAVSTFSIRPDNQKDGGVDAFYRIMDVVLDLSKQPVLFHCHSGFHRTGMIALALRYIQGGEWTKKLARPLRLGRIIADNKAKMEYLYFNPNNPRAENLEFIDAISLTPRFLKLKEKFKQRLNNK